MVPCDRCYYHGKHYSGGKLIKGMTCSMQEYHPNPGHCPYFVEWRGGRC